MTYKKLLKPTQHQEELERGGGFSLIVWTNAMIWLAEQVAQIVTVVATLVWAIHKLLFPGVVTIDLIPAILIAGAAYIILALIRNPIKDAILDSIMENYVPVVAESMQATLISVAFKMGRETQVQKIIDQAVVLSAGDKDPDHVTIQWDSDEDGVLVETIKIDDARKKGIRGGHVLIYRRVIHDYGMGLGLIQESEKLTFYDNNHQNYLIERQLKGADDMSYKHNIGVAVMPPRLNTWTA